MMRPADGAPPSRTSLHEASSHAGLFSIVAVIAGLWIGASAPAAAQPAAPLERGRYLVTTILACGNCHTPKDAEGRPITCPRPLVEQCARRDRDCDSIRSLPPELLRELVGERLRAFGVVRPQIDVDEPPRELERQLDGESRAVVVRPVDGVDLRAVDGGGRELLRLEVAGDEDGSLEAFCGCTRRHGTGQVPGGGARERVQAELLRLAGGDGDDAILEGMRRVGRIQLEPQLADPELLGEAGRRHERRQTRRQSGVGRCHDREQVRVTPHRGRAGLDRSSTDATPELFPVVRRVEWAEAAGARAGRDERMLGRANAAAKGNSGHGAEPPGRRSTSVRDWHRHPICGQVAEASKGRSLSLSRCGAGVSPRQRQL